MIMIIFLSSAQILVLILRFRSSCNKNDSHYINFFGDKWHQNVTHFYDFAISYNNIVVFFFFFFRYMQHICTLALPIDVM